MAQALQPFFYQSSENDRKTVPEVEPKQLHNLRWGYFNLEKKNSLLDCPSHR